MSGTKEFDIEKAVKSEIIDFLSMIKFSRISYQVVMESLCTFSMFFLCTLMCLESDIHQ